MCEDNALGELLSFNFAGISDEVEDALSFKARNVDPRVQPYYSKILYAWYASRADHRNGETSPSQLFVKIADCVSCPRNV